MYGERSCKKSKLEIGFKNCFEKVKLRNVGIGLMIISNMGLKNLANEEINREYIETKREEVEVVIQEIPKKIYYEIYPEEFMRKMGANLCASYAKLVVQSKGYELDKVIYMNAWEMAYNLNKEGWNYVDSNDFLNLIMLKTNIENKYYNSSIKRIEKAKRFIDFLTYIEIKKDIENKEFEEAGEKISVIIDSKFNELPDGTMLFMINRNSQFLKRANKYRRGAPTHVIIKSDNMWRDYEGYNERVRTNEEMLKTTKSITHIVTPPEINSVQSIDIEIPEKITKLKGKMKLNKAIEYSQHKKMGMWHYISYRIYESEGNEITIRRNKIENEITAQGKSFSQENL